MAILGKSLGLGYDGRIDKLQTVGMNVTFTFEYVSSAKMVDINVVAVTLVNGV